MYTEKIPSGGPPSFSGRLVKYSYKLAVGAQKPNRPASIIRIPFRVMTIPGESMIVYCGILWYTVIYCDIYCGILWYTVIYCDIVGIL